MNECRVPEMQTRVDITREPDRDIDRVPKVTASKDEVGKIDPRAPKPDDPDAEPSTSSSSSAIAKALQKPVSPIAGPSGSSLPQTPVSSIPGPSGTCLPDQAAARPAPRKTADEQTRERVLAKRDKHKSDRIPGPTETGEETLTQEWTAFDLGHALKLLHSRDPAVIRRTLRRLHVRFWHAPSIRLSELLRHAGAPDEAIKAIGPIVDSCRVCRM